jgi:DNA (cytosine-5)-methyltransferase 1
MTVRVGSAFSGIGGFDLAAERAGMSIAWQIEIDPTATRVLERHWPEVPRYGDITQIDPAHLDPVDVVCGGSPCQNLSVAGSREGLAGRESRLFFDFVRLCDAFPDAWAVWENVPGVFSTHGGEDFAIVLREFTGYWPAVPEGGWGTEGVCIGPKRTVAWAVLDAQWFGVAQRRRRVFVVGHSRNRTGPYEILLEPASLRGDSPPCRKAGTTVAPRLASGAGTDRPAGIANESTVLMTQAWTGTFGNGEADVAGTLGGGSGQRGWPNDLDRMTFIPIQDVRGGTRDKTNAGQGIGIGAAGDPMYTLDATSQHAVAYTLEAHAPRYDSETETFVAHTLRAEGADASEDGTGRGTPLLPVAFSTNQRGEGRLREVHGSLTATHSATQVDGVMEGLAVRRLTPRETERLQGCPDDWTRWGSDGREISDSARYRLIGNAVAVPVVEWIFRRLARTIAAAGGEL